MLAQQYMTGEQAVRIVGSEAEPVWLKFDRDYIQGEFDFLVEGGSTQPVNESFRRQMAMQVVDAMAPFAGAGILDMPKLATYVFAIWFWYSWCCFVCNSCSDDACSTTSTTRSTDAT
jgi:hypothetical protein